MSNQNHLPQNLPEAIDRQQILEEASAVARHLRDAGVQWLPTADPRQVKTWRERFESTGASPNTTPEEQPRSAATTVTGNDKVSFAEPSQNVSATGSNTHTEGNIHASYSGKSLPIDQRHACLTGLAKQVANCEKCPNLASKRNKTVFGEGSVSPRVVFFGEAPGADEDRSGRPFVGAAGQLLTKMIEACKFDRSDVYILNTIKCRPPNNRNPEQEEKSNCREYYQIQIDTLRPEYIICLGAVAAQELLQSKASVGSLRGRFHRYHDSKVLVTYHPAYLLREPTRKKAAWQDLQMMLRDAKIDF